VTVADDPGSVGSARDMARMDTRAVRNAVEMLGVTMSKLH